MKKKPTKEELAQMEPRKRAAVLFYQRHRKRLLKNANDYYANHREAVLEKAKVRYANSRPDYFCIICRKVLPRTLSGHHLFCEKCGPLHRKRKQSKKAMDAINAAVAAAAAAEAAAKAAAKKKAK